MIQKVRKISHGGGRKQKGIIGRCIFTLLPPEMFINICQNLPPVDLLSLARVCKRFNGFLSAENSMTTQEIWKASRETFLQFLQMLPPTGMSERQYVRLVLERGCQFCGKTKIRKVYWEFLVRCCEDCLKERTKRQEEIRQDMPDVLRVDDVLSGLPFISSWHRRSWDRGTKNRPSSLYWTKDVIVAYEEYKKIPIHDKNQWIKKKREEGVVKMKEVNDRKKETDKELRNKIQENSIKKNERVKEIRSRLEKMKSEKNEYGIFKYSEVLTETTTYKKTMSYMNRKSPQPFTDRAWNLLRRKLEKEYNELSQERMGQRIEREKSLLKDTIIQMRQFDIYQIAKQWIPDPETKRKIDEFAFSSTTTLEISSNTILDSTTSNSSNISILNHEPNNIMTNDTTAVKVEDTLSMSDFTPIKVENTDFISKTTTKVEDNSMNIDDLTSTSDTPMKIDNLIITSDTTSTNLNDLTLIPDNYMPIPDMTNLYFSLPPIPNTTIFNDTFSYACNNDTSYNTDTNSVMSIDSLISHDNFPFGFGSTSAAASSSNPTLAPVYTTNSVFYNDPMDIVVDQYSLDLTSTASPMEDDYFVWDPLFYSEFDSSANSNIQQDENRFNIEKYLPWCPSFKNPPFHNDNPYNLWDEDYLMKTLIPQIWCEATQLLNNFGSKTSVQGAVLGGYRENNMFKCKVCVSEFAKEQRLKYDIKKLRSYREARLHLIDFHSVRNINDDDMIEFVPDFNTSISLDPMFNTDFKKKLFAIGYNFNLLDDLVKY